MIVECTACNTIFPVDPKKVPAGGVHARCSVCSEVFFVSVAEPVAEPMVVETTAEAEAPGVEESFAETSFGEAEEEELFEPTFGAPEVELPAAVGPVPEDLAEVLEEVPGAPAEEPGFPEDRQDISLDTPFETEEETVESPEAPPTAAPLFGKRDPLEKAQRLARVLVSDIILYNPDRHHMATESGRVKEEFEDEIQKSWDEYVEQVGEEIANTTTFFSEALNEILAKGEQIF